MINSKLTDEVWAEFVPAEMVEQWWEYGEQHHVDVVEAGGPARDGSLHVAEPTLLQVLHQVRQVVCCVVEER